MVSLVALFFPAVALLLGLTLLGGRPGNGWMHEPIAWPFELWVIACTGTVATVAGWLDHRFHRNGGRQIPDRERRCEAWALLNGGLVFVLLSGASVAADKGPWIVPVFAATLSTVVLISYDEFLFHRRVGGYERCLHRLLTFGNGIAFLAWCHWCFSGHGRIH